MVTSDARVAAIAQHYSIALIADPGGGLNVALEFARVALLTTNSPENALLILPIDLPFASPDALLKAASFPADIVIAADDGATGTNLLLLRTSALRRFPFCYGPSSYAAHVTAARRSGFAVEELSDWRLTFDIDDPAKYATWIAWQERATDTANFAAESCSPKFDRDGE